MILFISDLDNTLIYSYKHYDQGICVEIKEGKRLSFMTPHSYALLQQVAKCCLFVPLTTRSLEQYNRIRLLQKSMPAYAITGNGATLLVNGQIDLSWQRETEEMIADSVPVFAQALALLAQDKQITLPARVVDQAFVYCKSADIQRTMERLAQGLDLRRVVLNHHKEKLYLLPVNLTKGTAVQRLKQRLRREWVIAAGDSSFDLSMLQEADLALIPQHSPLEEALKTHRDARVSPLPGCQFAEMVLQTVMECQQLQDQS